MEKQSTPNTVKKISKSNNSNIITDINVNNIVSNNDISSNNNNISSNNNDISSNNNDISSNNNDISSNNNDISSNNNDISSANIKNMDQNTMVNLLIATRKTVFLKLLNKVLENIGKSQISDILDFKNIEQELLIKESNTKIIENMMGEIDITFSKSHAGSKKTAKKYPLNFIKSLAKQINMDLSYKKKDKTILVDGVLYRRSTYYYSLHII